MENIHVEIYYHADAQFAPLDAKGNSLFLFLTIHLNILQCGHSWWHDKFPNDIRRLSTYFEVICGMM
jgi:hypothetical protein